MAELTGLMDQKKYRKATALADSLTADVAALKSTVQTNGKDMAGKMVESANQELGMLKVQLSPENLGILGDAAQKYTDQIQEYEGKIATMQSDLDNGAYLQVHENSPLVGQISATVQSFNTELEQAKAVQALKKKPARRK
ncbi:MAG: hypothetical protein V1794_18700 [Candidatus Glassbacteria bacterium]